MHRPFLSWCATNILKFKKHKKTNILYEIGGIPPKKITGFLTFYLLKMKTKIAFIGSVGVPNNYGGFEMFLDSCTPYLAKNFNEVIVTCDRSRYKEFGNWLGVTRLFLPISANGAQSILHDLMAFFAVFLQCRVIIVLGVSAGIFFPIFRLLCAFTGKKLIVNVDGLEWRRNKFSKAKRSFLYLSDRLAQFFAHQVIVDNEALRPFLIKKVQDTAELIAYPGDHVLRVHEKEVSHPGEPNYLTICRIEPENNCHILLEAFLSVGKGRYIFVGNWDASDYGRKLRALFKGTPGLEMRDPIYNATALATLRENCTIYLHGHSVGGTNPSLVEMLFYDCNILAYDCAFNRATAGDTIEYFINNEELGRILQQPQSQGNMDRTELRGFYTRSKICDEYTRVIRQLIEPVSPLAVDKTRLTHSPD